MIYFYYVYMYSCNASQYNKPSVVMFLMAFDFIKCLNIDNQLFKASDIE